MITSTNEALEKLTQLKNYMKTVRYNHDLNKLLKNIEGMITELSKKEVLARQTKKVSILEIPLKNLNESVDNFEKLLIIAKLLN
jgi:hypothetical protein